MMNLYVSPCGNDSWSGKYPEPNAENTDGPLASLQGARDQVRTMKQKALLDGQVTVQFRDGRYHVDAPVVFGPDDSYPVTYTSYADENAVIDGGVPIKGWEETTVNDVKAWVTTVPGVAEGTWFFRQLFVNGERRLRPRTPREGFHRIADYPGSEGPTKIFAQTNEFTSAPGDIKQWKNLNDVEIVVLHYWIEERSPIESFDESTNTVTCARTFRMQLRDDQGGGARYYVDNVFEELSQPGDWYLDRNTGKLYYIPMPGEEIGTVEVFAPRAHQLLVLEGKPECEKFVEFLKFENLTFEHTIWEHATPDMAASMQSANLVPGVIQLTGARNCAIENCGIAHIGSYAVELSEGCRWNRIVGNDIWDMGAGGIKLNGATADGNRLLQTGENRVTDNHIHHGGRIFHSGVGILSMHSFGNTLSHNHIHDFYYTGISCGWVWGYRDSVSKNNHIENNHIHGLGFGWLSDMGGIYTLGVQPGTVLRGNLIHDVKMSGYGGWAIYPDEGSSHIIIENNIGYNTSSQGFHQHYGRENIVRNNIFALGNEGMVRRTRLEEHVSFTFEKNIIYADSQPIHFGDRLEEGQVIIDANLYWDAGGTVKLHKSLSNEEWKDLGNDLNSVVADPGLADPAHGDFTMPEDSPAFALGFKPIDMSDVGPREQDKRD